MRECDKWILRNIELYFNHIYKEAVEFIDRGLEVVIRTHDNKLYVFEVVNENMYLLTKDLDNITEEEIKAEFRRQLKYRMRMMQIMQNDLADFCGVTQTAISRYMTGDNIPNVFVVAKMAEALGCTLNDLIFQKDTYREVISMNTRRKEY